MDMRKLFSIFFIILLALIAYNFILVPLVVQNYGGMGMEMHRGMHSNLYGYSSYFYQQLFAIGIVILAVLLLAGLYFSNSASSNRKCTKCGYDIDDERWKICPHCGSAILRRKDDIR